MENYFREKKQIENNRNEIVLQCLDWIAGDEETNDLPDDDDINYGKEDCGRDLSYSKYIIKCFGVNREGESLYVKIMNYKPYFYLKIPSNWTNEIITDFKNTIKNKCLYNKDSEQFGRRYEDYIVSMKIEKKKDFYGFHNDKQFRFLKIVFTSENVMKKISYLLRNNFNIGNIRNTKNMKTYESNLPSLLRFYHIRNILPTGWVSIKKYRELDVFEATTQYEIICDWNEINSAEELYGNNIAPILQASFDIETYSHTGAFPTPDIKENVVFQIATSFKKYGDSDFFVKHLICLKDCAPIHKDEANRRFLEQDKPKSVLVINTDEIGENPNQTEEETIEQNDLNMNYEIISQAEVIVECYNTEKEVLMAWQRLINKMDPDILYTYNGDKFDCNYLYERAKLCKILNRFSLLGRLKDIRSNITEETFESGAYGTNHYKRLVMQGRINFDLLIYIMREKKLDMYKLDFVSKEYLKDAKVDVSPKEMFKLFREGTPIGIKKVGVYCIQDTCLPMRLMDKLDVIPVMIEMSKITCVPFSFLIYKGQQIKVFSQITRDCRNKGYVVPHLYPDNDHLRFKGATVLTAKSKAYFGDPVTTLDFASLYPTLMMANNICYTSYVIDEKYDNLPGVDYLTVEWEEDEEELNEKQESYTPPKYTGKKLQYRYRYAQNNESILPTLLNELYTSRKAVKKMMGKEDDPFKKSVLNSRQLAIKVSMNSIYGFLASQMVKCKALARTVTTIGRQMLVSTQDFIHNDWVDFVKNYQITNVDKKDFKITMTNKVGDNEIIPVGKTVIDEYKEGEYLVDKPETYQTECVYGDSVTGDTPLLIKNGDNIYYESIDNIGKEWLPYNEFKPDEKIAYEKSQSNPGRIQIWTDKGWTNIKRVIKHKTYKKIFRVITISGCIDVTEDHSLLTPELEPIKPTECKRGVKLLHSFPETTTIGILPKYKDKIELKYGRTTICQCNINRELCENNEKLILAYYYYYTKHMEKNRKTVSYIHYLHNKNGLDTISVENKHVNVTTDIHKIKKIFFLRYTDRNEFVYDLETDCGRFAAGIGELVVKNTDSVFFINKTPITTNIESTRLEKITEAFKLGIVAGELATKRLFKHPVWLEFEKVYYNLILIQKKMYIGPLYEKPDEMSYIDTKGVALKRRNYCKYVKGVCQRIVDVLITEELNGVDRCIEIIKEELSNLIHGKIDMDKLTMTTSLKDKYKLENAPQVALRDKLAERDPGSAPQSGDRMKYLYVTNQIKDGKFIKLSEKSKNYEKIEDPDYAKANRLDIDTIYYIEKQLYKPISQIFSVLVDGSDELLNSYIVKAQNMRRGQRDIMEMITGTATEISKLKLKPKRKQKKDIPDKNQQSILSFYKKS